MAFAFDLGKKGGPTPHFFPPGCLFWFLWAPIGGCGPKGAIPFVHTQEFGYS